MLITQYLNEPCPYCGTTDQFGNVNVGNNILNRGCNSCGEWIRLPLPDIKKDIIYLDQFFLSHAFRKRERPFIDAVERIRDLASRQLLVCPYSSVHTDETHLWRHQQQEDLFTFIKKTARGHEFNQPYDIKQTQLHRAFESFLAAEEPDTHIEERDAFRDELHKWDDYFWIDLKPILGDLEAMRQGKAAAIAALVDLFPEWAKLKTTFQEDISAEARGYGKSLIEQYFNMVISVGRGNLLDYMQAPMDTIYVESLLHYNSSDLDIERRHKRIGSFFGSEYFCRIPNIWISCGLFAVLRKMVKNGAFTNPEKSKKKLSGLFYDSECISVFGPYCDAIFIDRSMHQWCDDAEVNLFEDYPTRIFSAKSWDEFHEYLDNVESRETEEIRESHGLVYP